MRFCLAPMSSSPSSRRTGTGDLLRSLSTGTDPLSEVSVTSTDFAARASSRRMKASAAMLVANNGKISSRPWRRGSPIETPERSVEMAVIMLLL